MALWRSHDSASALEAKQFKRLLDKEPPLIQHGGFFVSDGGGGVCIDYVERRQAVKRKMPKIKKD